MTSNLLTRVLIIFFVIALSVTSMVTNWPISFGIDLKGGSILTYRIEDIDREGDGPKSKTELDQAIDDTVNVIAQRVNKEGVKDILVRREGNYIVITLANFTAAQTEKIRDRMTQMGLLELPIAAEDGDEAYGVTFNATRFNQEREEKKAAYRAPKGFACYPVLPQQGKKESAAKYKERRAKFDAKELESPWDLEVQWFFYDELFWSLEYMDDPGITGRDIYAPLRTFDENGGGAVSYRVRESAQHRMAGYSQKYKGRIMALVLNGHVWSTARIQSTLSDNVQITGGSGGYSEQEQKWLISCLQSGSLKLKPVLESQEQVGATLGALAVDRAKLAFIAGTVIVVLFMLYFYGFVGSLAIIALLLNFVFVFGILMLLEASLTLPGLAGLVLTVGMAVDANILIFERIREELDKGKRLIHAAKNGFDRAFVTIFDANLTTFIVAAFLVYYGKGPIKGFGYTLMTGIVCSMFAALYVTRTLLGIALSRGWVSDLKMRRILDKPAIPFLSKAKAALTGSVIVIIIGLVSFGIAGDSKYGLDFNGGTAVQMVFNEPVTDTEIKDAIATLKNENGNQKYQAIEANLLDPEDGKSRRVDLRLDYEAKSTIADSDTEDGADAYAEIRAELTSTFAGKLVADPITDISYNSKTNTWSGLIHLDTAILEPQKIIAVCEAANLQTPQATLADETGKEWQIKVIASPDIQREIDGILLNEMQKTEGFSLTTPFPKVRFVGPLVVSQLKTSAFQAMILSLLFILAYIWFRFKELKYGLAAAGALIHDVLISLGVVVIFNMTGLVDVPITLNVIAAFLTIIGYSLNDTIVVFDRIRENLGSMQGSFADVVNRSINQTLTRTILTSVTTFVVISAIFVANYGLESPLEGLSFTLLVGVLVGTYSSIFVASPILTWTHNKEEQKQISTSKKAVTAKA